MGSNDRSLATRLEEGRQRVQQFLISGFGTERSASKEEAWWPYHLNQGPSVEATSWSSIALSGIDHLEARQVRNGVANFLVARQNRDGGWSTAPDAGNSDWNSAVALLCLRGLEAPQILDDGTRHHVQRSVQKGMDYLLDSRAEFYKPIARLLLLVSKGSGSLNYPRGWPWDPNCFHWVEPTSYSLIAMKIPHVPSAGVYKHVVEHANQFLLEHACKGGGWNHGNDITLGAFLPPYRLTTAEALVALQDVPRDHKAIVGALEHLESEKDKNSSAISLSWSIIARHAYDQKPHTELSYLLERQNKDGSFGVNSNLHVSAIALIALNTMSNKDGHAPLKLNT